MRLEYKIMLSCIFYQWSVVELSQIGHISSPIKLCDVDVEDIAAALFFILFILYILIFIFIYIHTFCQTSSEKTTLQYRSCGLRPPRNAEHVLARHVEARDGGLRMERHHGIHAVVPLNSVLQAVHLTSGTVEIEVVAEGRRHVGVHDMALRWGEVR